ncbi:MAG: alpha-amylase [Gallionellales bacterium 35-53-114]|jgi:amylosucrase|nr:MAG: alpha-amylase [Gallionellales bacterium 35-53-114]OYZ63248.1 MAG: alpha-amylase [Gallionellales bacterium 24-53-125]OZB08713.1 MAG: alpha-amylase [Gallionellales bacterium 39-52-133]HQS57421.1 amylosucrase [Gallionellaceae bacterium]HQS74391.1 amylosucrase [Gallionellaceae bacterium]
MYEQASHALLNEILTELKPEIGKMRLRHFYTRLGANFYAIHSLFHLLYGNRPDFKAQMVSLVETLAFRYIERLPHLRRSDLEREINYNWFLSQKWVGMALYCDRFAADLKGLRTRLPYLQELGVNMLHIMPILDCPADNSDGGYAVRDFLKVDARFGTNEDVEALASTLKKREMLLVLDVVVNHTSNEHEWAVKARQGDKKYQDYFHMFDDRETPDLYEETMPEIFPATSPGNFTWDEAMGKWVMTVFNSYQWDLNYRNPAVLIEMIDIILFWANKGADILRLDAVAFLWKKIGSTCQNEREAHLLLQLMKDCCQVTAPGVLFIAEAIVAPSEIAKYFGEDAINAKECEIAYNATLMALLWDAVATKNARLLNQGIKNLPEKIERATWLNYVRCHDDIGLGFDDSDVQRAGYEPAKHRHFLLEYFTGKFPGSLARGLPFGENTRTGDARISGSLASLVGLEAALESGDEAAIGAAINTILLLHGMILSFGGIPLLYYGDAIGMLNNLEYLADPNHRLDTRWAHRSRFDWSKADKRHKKGTVEFRIFSELKKMIALRKETPAFADFDNRQLLAVENQNLLAFIRTDPQNSRNKVLVVGNFSVEAQMLQISSLRSFGLFQQDSMRNICTGAPVTVEKDAIIVPALCCYWLTD